METVYTIIVNYKSEEIIKNAVDSIDEDKINVKTDECLPGNNQKSFQVHFKKSSDP